MTRRRAGFTLAELLVVIGVIFVAFVLIALMGRRTCGGGRQIEDSANVREVHKGMLMWAQQNNSYPIPSLVDRADDTVAADGDATLKDGSAAVYSILIFNALVTPEVLVSPHEANGNIREYRGYECEEPSLAVRPEEAHWDTGFRATPFDPAPGLTAKQARISHTSYTHLAIAGTGRMAEWNNTLSSNYPVLGNRGPEETVGTWNPASGKLMSTTLAAGRTGTNSVTLLIHGSKNTWEGNIAYNDNHVNFETTSYPDGVYYTVGVDDALQQFGDGLFLDEGDPGVLNGAAEDVGDSNCYLGLFSVGPTAAQRREHGKVSAYIKAARWYDGMKK